VLQRFKWTGRPFTADVSFLIMRDGSVPTSSIRVVSTNGNYAFNLEASGAIESAGDAKAFGPLPTGFSDDVLAVVFTFDPKFFRQ
jgi:outer membrane biosynthesis protein TonB